MYFIRAEGLIPRRFTSTLCVGVVDLETSYISFNPFASFEIKIITATIRRTE